MKLFKKKQRNIEKIIKNYFENKYKYPFIPIVDNKGEPIASNYHIYEDIGDTNCSYLKIDDKLKRDKTSNLFLNINEKQLTIN